MQESKPTNRVRKGLSSYALIAVLLASLFPGGENGRASARPLEGRPAWSDEFDQKGSRWDWGYNTGTGYKRLVQAQDGTTAVELGITAASTSAGYSDCSLHETTKPYTSGSLEMRLRTTDDNGMTQPGQGTRGWGFWDGGPNAAWFWSASPESSPLLTGLRVQVWRDNDLRFNLGLANIDMRQWHTYRVDVLEDEVRFFVDGEQVAATPERSAGPFRPELWLDNIRITLTETEFSTSFLDVNQEQKMYIDWVRYYEWTPNRLYLPSIQAGGFS